MSFGTAYQYLGQAAGIVAATAAPTLPTDGFDTFSMRFVNIWLALSGGTSADIVVWLYRASPDGSIAQWVLYTDVPQTTYLTANGGGVMQLELRGAERIYIQFPNVTVGTTASYHMYGVNYAESAVGAV